MIHICDDFFKDPYKVRSIALKAKYVTEKFNYPGMRSFDVPEEISDNILQDVRYYTKNKSLNFYKPNFQYVTEDYGEGIFHIDQVKYTCMVYLSLNPPANSGTDVCDRGSYAKPSDMDFYDEKTRKIQNSFHKDPSNLIIRYQYGRIRKKINSYYTPYILMTVPNKFNRFILFPGNNLHRAQNYFGTSLEKSRLTLVSFFK